MAFGVGLFGLGLALLEGTLAVFGVGDPYLYEDPFVGFAPGRDVFTRRVTPGGEVVYATNPDKLRFFHQQQFAAEKPPGTYRIFALGGSTTAGRPYDDKVSFPRWLERYLRLADGSRHYEVVNAGAISYASYRVVLLARELLRHQPDLFVVYTGHNEFLEERTYSSLIHQNLALKRLRVWLAGLRSYTLAEHAWKRLTRDEAAAELPAEVTAKLDVWSGLDLFHRDDELRRSIVEHFQYNLLQLAAIARDHGVALVFIKPASNVKDFSPFKSEHPAGLAPADLARFDERYAAGKQLLDDGRPEAALEALAEARQIDPEYADLLYRIGRAELAKGDLEAAREDLVRAKDLDVAPLRALSEMAEMVAQVARRNDLPFVDLPAVLEADARERFGNPILGEEYFLDHVHPDIPTYSLIAREVIERLVERHIVPRAADPAARQARWQAAYDRVLATIDRRYYAERDHNLGKVLGWAGKVEEAERALLRAAEVLTDNPEVHLNLGIVYEKTKRWEASVRELERAATLDPTLRDLQFNLGTVYAELGRKDDAIAALRRAVRQQPQHALATYNLGLLLREKGELEAALRAFERARQLRPEAPEVYRNLGEIYRRLGRLEEARAAFEEGLDRAPSDRDTLLALGITLGRAGRYQEAIDTLQRAIELAPQDAELRYNLGVVLAAAGRPEAAATAYAKAVELDPHAAHARNNLAILDAQAGRLEEARTQLSAAIEADPRYAEAYFNLGVVFDQLGDPQAAVAAIERAVAIEPDNARFHYTLGMLYSALGEGERAERHFAAAGPAAAPSGGEPPASTRQGGGQ